MDDSFSQIPLYQGTAASVRSSSSSQFQPIPVENRFNREILQGAAAINRELQAAEQAWREQNDYTLELNRKADIAQIAAARKEEYDTRSSLPDGDPNSFFNADHTLRQDAQKEFSARYNAMLKGLDKGYQTIEGSQRAQEQIMQLRQSFGMSDTANFLKAGKARARVAFESNLYALMSIGDNEGCMNAIAEGLKRGAIAPEESGYYNRKVHVSNAGRLAAHPTKGADTYLGALRSVDQLPSVDNAAAEEDIASAGNMFTGDTMGDVDLSSGASDALLQDAENANLDPDLDDE